MRLPALLPKDLHYTEVAVNERNLLNLLVKIPPDLITFFEYACGDETWSSNHPELMKGIISWLTNHFFQDRLLIEFGQRAIKAIREHYQVLEPFIPHNLSFIVEKDEIGVNSLMWEASSEFLRTLIRQECRDKNTKTLSIPDVSHHVFDQVSEYIRTGFVQELWRKEQHEIAEVLNQAKDWELTELVQLCEDILKRYITKSNVIEMLLKSHEESLSTLRQACFDFINDLNVGVHLPSISLNKLSLEFKNFRETSLDIFERLKDTITHLRFPGSLTKDPHFSELIQRCPNVVCIDISHSDDFSDRLLDIPSDLQKLDLSKCGWLTDSNLGKMIEICPKLKRISLGSNIQLTYAGWTQLHRLSTLETLELSHCHQINDEDVKLIMNGCRDLEQINLESCQGIGDSGFLDLARNLKKLIRVNLTRTTISDVPLIDFATHCPNLTHLNVTRCVNLSEKGILGFVRQAPALQELNISRCKVPERVIDKIREIRPFLNLTR